MGSIRIAVVEDQRMVRELVVDLLKREVGFEIVAEASTGREAIELAKSAQADVLVLGVSLPALEGIEVARKLRSTRPEVRILALSIHEDRAFVQQMLDAGVDGYVVKSAAVRELVDAIHYIFEGGKYFSPAIIRFAARKLGGFRLVVPQSRLTARERQVLALIAEGQRSASIARDFRISVATVEVHRRNIMRKLDMHTIAQLTKYAVREGLTPR